MEIEERPNKTELILMNTRNFRSKICNLKKMMKKNNFNYNHINHINKGIDKTKYFIYRNQNIENKYKITGTQTTKSTYENNNNTNLKLSPLNKKKKDKKILFNEIKILCDSIYDTNSHQDNGFRIKLREDIVRSIDNYVFSDLRKNILYPRSINDKNKKIKIHKFNFLRKKEKLKEKEDKEEKNCDSNKVSMKDIFKNENEDKQNNERKIKVYKYKYEDYAINDIKYNHPQKYTLNNTFRRQHLFPIIKPPKTLNSFRGFAHLIPEKRINKKEVDKQIYKAYRTMKIKNKKEKGIHI